MRCTMAHTSAKLDWKDEGIHSSKGGTSPPLLKPVAPFSSSPPLLRYTDVFAPVSVSPPF